VERVMDQLGKEFAVRKLGCISYFLGIQVRKAKDGLHLCQTQYLVNLLKGINLDNMKPSTTPMLTNQDLYSDEPPIEQVTEYRRIVGSLQYLTLTRPDIQFAVNKLSQFMSSPKPLHWTAMKKVLRYLSGTQSWGITLGKVNDFAITGYCDADWAGDKVDRKSQTGYLIYIDGTLVAWSSRKQSTVSRSSTESEYRAIATTIQELEWVKNLLVELGVGVKNPITLKSDNRGAVFLATNSACHSKLKHVAIDLKYVRERIDAGSVHISHIPGTSQQAELLTKALSPKGFMQQRINLVRPFSQD